MRSGILKKGFLFYFSFQQTSWHHRKIRCYCTDTKIPEKTPPLGGQQQPLSTSTLNDNKLVEGRSEFTLFLFLLTLQRLNLIL